MGVAVVSGSVTSDPSESATNSFTANVPAGSVGDLLIATYAGFSSAAATALSGSQAGYTFIGTLQVTDGGGDYLQVAIYRRIADGTEGATATFTQTATGPGGGSLNITRFSGVNAAAPVNASASASTFSGTSVTFPSVSPTVPNTLLYTCGFGYSAAANSGASWAAAGPSGFSMVAAASKDETTFSFVTHMGGATKAQAATGATGTFSATYSNGVLAFFIGFTIAIAPAVVNPFRRDLSYYLEQ